MLRNLGNWYKSKQGRHLKHKLYLSNCKMKPKRELQRKKTKQRRSASYSWKKQKTTQRTSKMTKMMLVMMQTLRIAIKQFSPFVIVMERLHKKGNWLICNICKKYISAKYTCQKVLTLNKTFIAKTAPSELNLEYICNATVVPSYIHVDWSCSFKHLTFLLCLKMCWPILPWQIFFWA